MDARHYAAAPLPTLNHTRMTHPTTPARRPDSWVILLVVVGLMAIGMATLLWAVTRPGIGLSPDSRSYISMSKFIAAGQGVMTMDGDGKPGLFTHLAPGLSVVMAVLVKVGMAAQQSARLINIVSMAAGVMLIALVAYFAGRRSVLAGIAAAAVVFFSTPVNKLYVSLISEPLFITELLITLLCLFLALQRKSWRWMIAGGIVAATMPMTRYAGIAVIGGAALAMLLQWPDKWKKRIVVAITFFAIAVLPTFGWLMYGKFASTSGRVANRQLDWHPPTTEQWTQARDELISWVIPNRWQPPTWLGVTVLLGTIALVVAVEVIDIRHHRRDAARVLRNICWIGAICYGSFIIVSVTLFDAYTPMDYRILLPLRVMLVPVNAAALLAAVGPMFRWRPVMGLAYAGLIALQVSMMPQWAKSVRNEGLGFNSEIYRTSPAINSVLSAPPGAIVYCNVADAAWLITERFCKPYPPIYNNTTAKPNPHAYYKKLPGIWKDLHDTDGRVVYYRHNRRKQQVGLERLVKDLQLIEVEHFKDGSIWKLDPAYSGPSLKWVEAEIKRAARAEKLAKQKKLEEHAKKRGTTLPAGGRLPMSERRRRQATQPATTTVADLVPATQAAK